MKVYLGAARRDIPPFNGIHEAYGPAFWNLLFQPRSVPTADEFVDMPEVQRSIADFARSMTNELCLIVGRRGVGKTSVLLHMQNTTWKSAQCQVVYECFRDESLPPPPGYSKWDDKRQRLYWVRLADEHVTRILRKNTPAGIVDIDSQSSLWSFFRFLNEYFPSASDYSLSQTTSLERFQKLFSRLADDKKRRQFGDSQYSLDRLLFSYSVVNNRYRHVKFIVDNLDDKHKGFIAALIEKLSHLQDSVRQLKVALTDQEAPFSVVLTPFVSVRPLTASALDEFRDSEHKGFGAGWNAIRRIDIDSPASLCDIVLKRYDNITSSREFGELADIDVDKSRVDNSLTVHMPRSSVRWEFSCRHEFMRGLLKIVTSSSQDLELSQLCNNDMSQAIPSLGNVLKNRFFLLESDVIAAIENPHAGDAVKRARAAVSRVAILKCLAYGNQGNLTPYYPIHRTRVANLLSGRVAPFAHTMAKCKAILALNEYGRDNRTGMPQADLCSALRTWTRLSGSQVIDLLDELWRQGLIESDVWEKRPSLSVAINENSLLSLTPRADALLYHLRNDTVLLLCYRDEVELLDTLEWKVSPHRPEWFVSPNWFTKGSFQFGSKHKAEELRDVFCMIEQIFCVEASEVLDCIRRQENGAPHGDYTRLFGTYLVTDLVLDSLENSLKRFYVDFFGVDLKQWRTLVGKMKEYVDGWKALTIASLSGRGS